MVPHEAEDAVGTPFVKAELIEGFGFFELAVPLVGGGGEVDAADGHSANLLRICMGIRSLQCSRSKIYSKEPSEQRTPQ